MKYDQNTMLMRQLLISDAPSSSSAISSSKTARSPPRIGRSAPSPRLRRVVSTTATCSIYRTRRSRPTNTSHSSPICPSCPCFGCSCSLGLSPLVFFGLPRSFFSSQLLFHFPSFGCSLLLYSFPLHVGNVLARPLPRRIEDKTLIMFGLGKYPGPSVEQARGR